MVFHLQASCHRVLLPRQGGLKRCHHQTGSTQHVRRHSPMLLLYFGPVLCHPTGRHQLQMVCECGEKAGKEDWHEWKTPGCFSLDPMMQQHLLVQTSVSISSLQLLWGFSHCDWTPAADCCCCSLAGLTLVAFARLWRSRWRLIGGGRKWNNMCSNKDRLIFYWSPGEMCIYGKLERKSVQ